MRENRTYGLTRGRSGSAASLYSTGKPPLRETPSTSICLQLLDNSHQIKFLPAAQNAVLFHFVDDDAG